MKKELTTQSKKTTEIFKPVLAKLPKNIYLNDIPSEMGVLYSIISKYNASKNAQIDSEDLKSCMTSLYRYSSSEFVEICSAVYNTNPEQLLYLLNLRYAALNNSLSLLSEQSKNDMSRSMSEIDSKNKNAYLRNKKWWN